jgi:hypothetical protein
MNDQIILFFYVDDIITLYYLRQIGDIKWFLGIRVEPFLATRQLPLIHDSLMVQVCTEFL